MDFGQIGASKKENNGQQKIKLQFDQERWRNGRINANENEVKSKLFDQNKYSAIQMRFLQFIVFGRTSIGNAHSTFQSFYPTKWKSTK